MRAINRCSYESICRVAVAAAADASWVDCYRAFIARESTDDAAVILDHIVARGAGFTVFEDLRAEAKGRPVAPWIDALPSCFRSNLSYFGPLIDADCAWRSRGGTTMWPARVFSDAPISVFARQWSWIEVRYGMGGFAFGM